MQFQLLPPGVQQRQCAHNTHDAIRSYVVFHPTPLPVAPPEEHSPRQRDIGGCQRSLNIVQPRPGDLEVNRLVMQVSKDRSRQQGEKRFSRNNFAAWFQLIGSSVQKRNGTLQVMQHISQRNDIEAVVLDSIQLIDFMAVKDKIQIVQIKNVAGNNV